MRSESSRSESKLHAALRALTCSTASLEFASAAPESLEEEAPEESLD